MHYDQIGVIDKAMTPNIMISWCWDIQNLLSICFVQVFRLTQAQGAFCLLSYLTSLSQTQWRLILRRSGRASRDSVQDEDGIKSEFSLG